MCKLNGLSNLTKITFETGQRIGPDSNQLVELQTSIALTNCIAIVTVVTM